MAQITKTIVAIALLICISVSSQGQIIRDYMNDANRMLGGGKSKKIGGTSLTENEISDGLRQALQVGAQNTTSKLSTPNGFFGNALIKVLMPPEAKKVETTLRTIGMGKYVDNAILTMNRAAEDASGKALPIFVNAIKGMSIQDAVSILKGGNNAATNYLKSKTTASLTSAFRPVIEQSLDKVNATKYWSDVFSVYNDLPTTYNKINPDLAAYVTERALNGLFVYIADEEAKIRMNPGARVTDLLKKVFGSK